MGVDPDYPQLLLHFAAVIFSFKDCCKPLSRRAARREALVVEASETAALEEIEQSRREETVCVEEMFTVLEMFSSEREREEKSMNQACLFLTHQHQTVSYYK